VPRVGKLDQSDKRHAYADHRSRDRENVGGETLASGSYRDAVGHTSLTFDFVSHSGACSSHAARRFASVRPTARWEAGEAHQLPRMTVSKRVADRDHVDEVQHRIALLGRRQSEMACPLDGVDQCSGAASKTNTASICRYRRQLWLGLIEPACAWDALLWATTFDECIQSVRYPAPSVRRPLIEIVYPIEKHSEHKPAFAFEDLSPVQTSGVRRINVVRLSGPAIGLRYAPILRSIFVSDTALLQWCAAQ
jgi:hypothetical protein